MGLYEVGSIEASTLVSVLKDCLIHFNTVCGQSFDGAFNISSIRQGVASIIRAPKIDFTHSYSHFLNLATSDMVKGYSTMKKMLDAFHDFTKLVKYSPHIQALFEKLEEEIAPGSPGICVLCTRWTVKVNSMKDGVLQELWEVEVADT